MVNLGISHKSVLFPLHTHEPFGKHVYYENTSEKGNRGFIPFFRNKFSGLFQDFSRTQIDFSRALKFTLTLHFQDVNVNSPYSLPYTSYFLVEFNRCPGFSRTSGLFPGLSSPGKCQNKIPGLSRFSRTCTNPVNIPWYTRTTRKVIYTVP